MLDEWLHVRKHSGIPGVWMPWLPSGFCKCSTRLTMTRVSMFAGEEMEVGNTTNKFTVLLPPSFLPCGATLQCGEQWGRWYNENHPTSCQRWVKCEQQENSVHPYHQPASTLPESPLPSTANDKGANFFLSPCNMLGTVLDAITYIILILSSQ